MRLPYCLSVSESIDLGSLYRDIRLRVSELVAGLDAETLAAFAPACPEWAVRDVLAHVVAIAEDAVSGRLAGLPDDEFTAGQVARMGPVPVPELLDRWSAAGPAFEQGIAAMGIWPAVVDAATHEQDIRGAVGAPGARQCAAITLGIGRLLNGLDLPVPVQIVTEDSSYLVGPGTDAEPLVLTTTRFEAFRWRMGRRSPDQLAAMAWSAPPPAAVLKALPMFGPSIADVHE